MQVGKSGDRIPQWSHQVQEQSDAIYTDGEHQPLLESLRDGSIEYAGA